MRLTASVTRADRLETQTSGQGMIWPARHDLVKRSLVIQRPCSNFNQLKRVQSRTETHNAQSPHVVSRTNKKSSFLRHALRLLMDEQANLTNNDRVPHACMSCIIPCFMCSGIARDAYDYVTCDVYLRGVSLWAIACRLVISPTKQRQES